MLTFEERVAHIKVQNEKQKEARRIRANERSRVQIRLKREEKVANGTLTNLGRKLTEDVPEEIRRIKSIPVDQLSEGEVETLYKYQQSHIKAYWDRQKDLKRKKEQEEHIEEQQQYYRDFMLMDLNKKRREQYDEWLENLARERFYQKHGFKYDPVKPYAAMEERMEFIKQKLHYEFKFRRLGSLTEDSEPLMILATKEEAKDLENELVEEQEHQERVIRSMNLGRPGRPKGSKPKDKSLEIVQARNEKDKAKFLKRESALSRVGSFQSIDTQKDLNNRPPLTENATVSEVKKRQLAERWSVIKQKRQEEKMRRLEQERIQRAIEREDARDAKQLEIERLRDFFDHYGMRYMRKKIITTAVIRNHLLPLMRKHSPEVFQEYAYSFCLMKGHMYSLSEEELDALELEFQRTGKVPTKLQVSS